MLCFGAAAFALHAPRGTADALPLRGLLVASIMSGLILSLVGLAVLSAGMAGVGIGEVDRATVASVIENTAAGTAWMVRMAAFVGLLAASILRVGMARMAAALLGGVVVATLAWGGHGAAGDGAAGWVHLVADVLHLLAAGTWLGALVALTLLAFGPSRTGAAHVDLLHRALRGFSTTGTLVVAVIVITGAASGWLLVGPGGVPLLGTTLYGRLLLAKIGLFVVMLVFAWGNRYRLTPALDRARREGDAPGAIAALRWSLASETACAVVVLALVAWLGTIEPIARS
ncbi:copper resistance protein CopD [Sphingomonas adhaesiva]|uniref:Copper resistance protein CopD n=2 Tax=Sphingomonas adhaesiva TaxID=28212 RepID=A0A2A4IEF6_9SPHN|nr:copper resistance protein CopD [Sphingomonas adhaesiva]